MQHCRLPGATNPDKPARALSITGIAIGLSTGFLSLASVLVAEKPSERSHERGRRHVSLPGGKGCWP
jgi:hypothetical protein